MREHATTALEISDWPLAINREWLSSEVLDSEMKTAQLPHSKGRR